MELLVSPILYSETQDISLTMDGLDTNIPLAIAARQTIPSCSVQDALLALPLTSSIPGA